MTWEDYAILAVGGVLAWIVGTLLGNWMLAVCGGYVG